MAVLISIAGGLARRITWCLGLVWVAAAMPNLSAQSAPSPEYKLKAVFLFNFAQFVEWPARAFSTPDAPLVIGVLGENPFGAYLDELVLGEKIGARPLIVRRFQRVADSAECHILFISRSESATMEKSLLPLKGRSVLTVGDSETFTQQGGMVRFYSENGKIRFKINVVSARAAALTLSSKILSPTTIEAPGRD